MTNEEYIYNPYNWFLKKYSEFLKNFYRLIKKNRKEKKSMNEQFREEENCPDKHEKMFNLTGNRGNTKYNIEVLFIFIRWAVKKHSCNIS
jgi:hypothetical protein